MKKTCKIITNAPMKKTVIMKTFYEDLKEELCRHIPEEKIHPDFIYEGIENSSDYPIDYSIDGKYDPLMFLAFQTGTRQD